MCESYTSMMFQDVDEICEHQDHYYPYTWEKAIESIMKGEMVTRADGTSFAITDTGMLVKRKVDSDWERASPKELFGIKCYRENHHIAGSITEAMVGGIR